MKLIVLIVFFIGSSAAFSQNMQESGSLPLKFLISTGEELSLPLRGEKTVWIQDRKIIQGHENLDNIILTAKLPGQSLLRIGKNIFSIRVFTPKNKNVYIKLKEILSNLKGLWLDEDDSHILVKGTLHRMDDWIFISKNTASNDNFIFQAEIDEDILPVANSYFQKLFKSNNLPSINVQLKNGISLKLPEAQSNYQKTFETLLSTYGVPVEKDSSLIDLAPLIRVKITLAEIKKNLIQKYGVSWPKSVPLANTFNTQIDSSLQASLNLLEQNGDGKILATPTLLCRSGKEAHFFAGGEIPIKILNFKINDVVWKKYGVTLNIKPKADLSGRMSIDIETEVSTLDTSNSIEDIPGILSNKIKTHFDLEKSKTIILSGLIKQEVGSSKDGLIGLSKIPVLGQLFSSEDYHKNKTEFVVFVTPEIFENSEKVELAE